MSYLSVPYPRLQRQLAVALAATGLAAHTLPAKAQDAAALADVTVKARAEDGGARRNLATGLAAAPLDTPFSVTEVPGQLVREQAGTSLQDALRNVPGAQADSGFNGAHTQFFTLRGAISDSGTGSNRVLRDGVRLSNYPYVPAFVERVEVLNGPGAALGVRSEPGGSVNIATRQPELRDFGSATIGTGSAGAREFSVDLNRVLSLENELAARLVATRSHSSEWRHLPDRLDGLKLGIAKSEGQRYQLRAGVEVTNQSYRPDYGVPAINGQLPAIPRDRQFGEPFGDSTTNNRIVDLHGDFALGADTRLALDFTRLDAHSTSIKNLLSGAPLAGQAPGTFARVSAWEPDTRRRIDSLATSLSASRQAGDWRHQLFASLEYYRETLDQPSLQLPAGNSPPINIFNPVYGRVTPPTSATPGVRTTQDLDAFALSAQDQLDWGDWSLVAGARFDRQKFLYGGAGVRPVTESTWSPKLAVLRRFGASETLYANLASGTSPNQVSSSSNQSLPSRRAKQAELGWKSLWRDGQLSSNLAVYTLAQSNMISSDLSTPLNNFDFTTGGTARSRGIEASLRGQLAERLEVALAYALTDAKYRENAVYGGRVVPNVARQTLNLWGQYRWDAQWKSGAGLYLQGRRFADEANTTALPGYARVDLTQSWLKKLDGERSLELQFALRNLFDRAYYVSSHLHVSRWIMPAEGRNLMLTATYRY